MMVDAPGHRRLSLPLVDPGCDRPAPLLQRNRPYRCRQLIGDTLIDVGGHRLHFKVWQNPGSYTLVFESGGGAAIPSWESVPTSLPSTSACGSSPMIAPDWDRARLGLLT